MKAKYYYFLLPFLMDMAAGLTLFCFPLYAREYLQLNAVSIGLISGTLACLYMGLNLFFYKIETFIKVKRMIYLGPILITMSYLSLGLTKNIILFMALSSLGAVGHALFWPAFETQLTLGKSAEAQKKNLGSFNLGWSSGLTISGPLLGGVIYGLAGPKTFFFAGLTGLLGLILNLLPWQEEDDSSKEDLSKKGPKVFNQNLLYLIWFSNFLSFLVLNITRTFFPLLGLELKMPPSFIGFILFLPGLSQIIITLFLKNNPAWSYNLKTIMIGQLLAISGLILIGFSDSIFFIGLGLFLPGFMAGITNYSSNFMSLSQEEKGKKRIGVHEALVGLAGCTSGFVGGGVAGIFGLRGPYLFCSLFILSAIGLQFYLSSFPAGPSSVKKKRSDRRRLKSPR